MTRQWLGGRAWLLVSVLSLALGMAGVAQAGTVPTGGQVVSGSGQINHAGDTTTITQNSAVLSINWQQFNIGAGQTVNFLQPGKDAIAVNRVLGNSASKIFGKLNANGQVWLINPNGVLFGKHARVHVGGLVATTLQLQGDPSGDGDVHFSGTSRAGIVNRGHLVAAPGGYIALLGNHVTNAGVIRARLGTVAMAGGSAVTLTFKQHHLLHLAVNRSTLSTLVANHELVVADGGQVLMTAGARDSLIASVVNNTGEVRARGVAEHNGTITLLSGMQAGQTHVSGTLDAGAPQGGHGGFIETSGARVQVSDGANITTASVHGKAGTWLIDPTDFTIASGSGGRTPSGIGADTLADNLGHGDVTIQTANSGSEPGDIYVNAALAWSSGNGLTLDADHNVILNDTVTAHNGDLTVVADGFVNNAGANALDTHWMLYTAKPANNTLGGITPDFIQYNTTPGGSLQGTGNGLVYSLAPTLTIDGLKGTVSKVYDGGDTANLVGANLDASGLESGDSIVAASGGTYASTDVGNHIKVSLSASTIDAFTIAHDGIPVYGYQLGSASVSAQVGQITPKPLTATIIGDPTKVYDGTVTATLDASNYEFDGFVSGQGATVDQPSSVFYAGVNAGPEAVNAIFKSTNFTAGTGTNLDNYILPTTATGMGTITRAPVTYSGLLVNNKVYDGNTTGSVNTGNVMLHGVISADKNDVTLDTAGATGTFAQSDVGNNIHVAVGGMTLTGSESSNYQIVVTGNYTADITAKPLDIDQVTANNKVYDGTTAATLVTGSAKLDGIVGSDTVSLVSSAATGTFSQADVRDNLAVTTSGFALTGADAGNYSLVQPTLSANITPAPLTITMVGTPEKTYDGTDAITLGAANFNVTGFVGSQHAVVSQSAAHYSTPNAASDIDVVATLQRSDFTADAGTSISNYTFDNTITGVGLGTIDPLALIGRIINNPTKTYDGNTSASLTQSNLQLIGVLPGESISVDFTGTVGGSYSDPDAGVHDVSRGVLDSSHFAAAPGTLLSNYVLPTAYEGTGTIRPAPLTGQSISASIGYVTKVYDGSTNITLHPSDFILTGFVGSDGANVNTSITGHFGSADTGTNIPVSATLTKSDLTPTGSTNLNNYTLQSLALGAGDITPRPFEVDIIGDPTRVYDGNDDAVLTAANLRVDPIAGNPDSGLVGGEQITINPTATATYDSPDAGSRTITALLTPGNYTFSNGAKQYNYTLVYSASGPGTITRAPLYVTNVYAQNKTYDTNDSASLNLGSVGISGLVDSDHGQVTLNTAAVSAIFSQSDAGNDLPVTATGFSISGSRSGNYTLQPVTGLGADINKAPLTLADVAADNKTYDGNTAAVLDTGSAQLQGVLGSDTVGFAAGGASGTFRTAHAGNDIHVTAVGFNLTGADANNYTLAQPDYLSADIDPKALTAVIIGNPVKVYDGTDSATLYANDYQLTGFVGGDSATLPQSASASYNTQDVGTSRGLSSTLVVSDFLAAPGTDLSNYVLPTTGAGTGGQIKPKVINLSGSRVYDGSTTAAADTFGGGIVQGVGDETLTLAGSYTLSSKDVDTYTWTGTGSSLSLADGTNGGKASNYTLIGGNDTYTITPRPLAATFLATDKVYDGTAADTLSTAQLQGNDGNGAGLISGDTVTLDDATIGHFVANTGDHQRRAKDVDTNKQVAGDMSISGSDAGNYIFTNGTATAAITPKHITVDATAKNKQYDATTTATVASLTSAGVVAGDTVHFGHGAAGFSQKDVGNGLTVTVAGISKSGTDADNYVIDNVDDDAATTANITPRQLNLTGTRVYDGTTNASYTLFSNSGVFAAGFGGETLTLSGSGEVADKNVGNKKPVTSMGTLAIANGGNGGEASNYVLNSAKLTITKRPVTTQPFTAVARKYDGTTIVDIFNAGGSNGDAVLLQSASDPDIPSDAGKIAGDDVALIDPHHGTLDDKHAGNGKTVTSSGITGADAGNYLFTPGTTTVDIAQATTLLTITADDESKTYGETQTYAGTEFTATGLQGSDNINDIRVDFSSAGDAATANVGDYTITASNAHDVTGGNFDPSDYDDIEYVGGKLTIDPADLTATANKFTRSYDGTTYDGGNGVTYKGFVNGEGASVLSGTIAYGGDSQGALNAGTYTITASGLNANHGNYTITYAPGTLTIDPAVISLTGSRVYDGTRDIAADDLVLSGLVDGQTLVLSGTGKSASKNAVTYTETSGSRSGTHFRLGATPGGLVLTDDTGTASNYTLIGGKDVFTITPATLTLDAVTDSKVYDGNTVSSKAVTVSGLLSGDTLADLAQSFDSKNVQGPNGSTLAVDADYTIHDGNGGGNYTVVTHTAAGTITPRVIDLSGTRTYDATTHAAASDLSTGGYVNGVGSETLALTGSGSVADKDVGTNKPVTLGSLALGDGQHGGLVSNYTLAGGTYTLTITPATLDLAAVTDTKVYDGTTESGRAVTVTGLQGSDSVAGVTQSFDSENVLGTNGSTLAVDAGYTISDGNGGHNYTVDIQTAKGTITPRPLTAAFDADNKVYDGNTTATIYDVTLQTDNGQTGSAAAGLLSGDDVTLTGSSDATFADANAGTGKFVTGNMGITGSDAGNYHFTNSTATADIIRRVLDLSGHRTYDGTTQIAADDLTLSNLVAGEALGLSGTGKTASRNVATYTENPGSRTGTQFSLEAVAGGLVLADGTGKASNYTLIGGKDTFTITPAPVKISTANVTKTYDGNTTTDGTPSVVGGTLFTGDSLDTSSGDYAYGDPNAGIGDKKVTVGNVTINDGNGGDNYAITYVDNTTSTIDPAALTITAKNDSKTYDGLSWTGGNGVSYAGFVNNENASVLDLTGLTWGGSSQGASDVGSYAITPSGVTADNGNYTITYVSGTLAIDPATLSITANDASKTYGDTLVFAGSGFTSSGLQNGETIGSVSLSSAGAAATANVAGSPYTITASDAIGGTFDPDNYVITYHPGELTVDPRAIAVTATGTDKIYDGTMGDMVSLGSAGLVNGDTVTFTGVGNFNDPNAGHGKPVTVTGITAGGGDAGNYTFNTTTTATANITPAPLTITASDDAKTYDGLAYSGGNGVTYAGFVHHEDASVLTGTLGYTGNSQGAINAGSYTITPDGLSDGNYAIVYDPGRLTINKAAAVVTANSATLTYDGLAQDVTGFSVTGLVNGETPNVLTNLTESGGHGTDAGTYTHSYSGSDNNYALTFDEGTLTIDPATLSITANDASKTYGDALVFAVSDFTSSGLQSGQTIGSVSLSSAGAAATANVAGSPYTITASDATGGTFDPDNYVITYHPGKLTVGPLAIAVTATGTNKVYDGNTRDAVTLHGNDIASWDDVQLTYQAANFDSPLVGNGKPVKVTGIRIGGADAGNYRLIDPTTTTTANITAGRLAAFGVSNGLLARLGRGRAGVDPRHIPTPYGLAVRDAVGEFTGNQKQRHHVVERNRRRAVFNSGMALKVVDGGVRMPDGSP